MEDTLDSVVQMPLIGRVIMTGMHLVIDLLNQDWNDLDLNNSVRLVTSYGFSLPFLFSNPDSLSPHPFHTLILLYLYVR